MRLSICIPTYNFGAFIGETLDSIIANLRPGVEVVVLDGGSTDDTAAVVAERQARAPQVRYHRQDHRGGIDRDIAAAVELSRGEYCWLFSADDIMHAGAVDKVLAELASGHDVYLCEHTMCTADLAYVSDHPTFVRTSTPTTFDLGDPAQRRRYFRDARTSEAFFSYLAGPIFKRTVWDAAADIPESFYDTCWGLAGRLLSRVRHGLVVRYMAECLIDKRAGVDSFMDQGIVKRLAITIEGFAHIAETIFGARAWETFHIRRVTRGEAAFRFRRLVSVKIMVAESGRPGDVAAFARLVRKHYSNAGLANRLKWVMFQSAPVPVLVLLRSAKNGLNAALRGKAPQLPAPGAAQ